MCPFRYVGCFVDPAVLEDKLSKIPRRPLKNIISDPHVTVSYRPEAVDTSLFGTEVRLRITGYGQNANNEGVRVELSTQEPRLREQLQAIEAPHITLSVSETGKAVDTKYLQFAAIEPVELSATYGGYTGDRRIVTRP